MLDTARPTRETPLDVIARRWRALRSGPVIVAVMVVAAIATATAAWFSSTRASVARSADTTSAPARSPQDASTQLPETPRSASMPFGPPSPPALSQPQRPPSLLAAPRAASIPARRVAPLARATDAGGPQVKPLAVPAAAAAAPPVPPVDEVLVIPVPTTGTGPVLSGADPGVEPPALMSPKLTGPLQLEAGGADLSAIDIVVSDKGDVESVKLTSPVRDYREAMMLSAIKAWRFKPASVDGYPVRYRMRIYISVTSVATGIR